MLFILTSSALLAVVPAFGSDYTLEIFGNANMDSIIDEKDIAYVEGIIKGTNAPTNLSDANYDGKIDTLDQEQIKRILENKDTQLTFIDNSDRIVTIKKPVNRVLIFFDAEADMMRMLNAADKVVAIGSGIAEEKILLPDISTRPTVGTWSNPDYEAILSQKPDIIMAGPGTMDGLEDNVGSFAKVVRLDHGSPDAIIDVLNKLGYILDKRNEAEEYINWYDGYMNLIQERTKGRSKEDRSKVYIEFFPYLTEYKTEGKGSVGQELCTKAGGINIAADMSKSQIVDPEWVIEQNPDVIIQSVGSKLPAGYDVDNLTAMNEVWNKTLNRPELQNVTAIKDKRVYLIASDIYHTNIQSLISIAYIAKWLHPALFEDLDPKAIHREYLTRFQRIDYDLDKHGAFVYPPLEVS
ncbi:MAG: ABC transporter substrate-binding protein [Methanothrix sp.]|nr:ABC transporter substrate-binding protein [Methanothrix sp.]